MELKYQQCDGSIFFLVRNIPLFAHTNCMPSYILTKLEIQQIIPVVHLHVQRSKHSINTF
jgi:hypothetical protein